MTRGNNREVWVATGGAGVVGEASERKGHKEPWLVKTNKNKKIKKGLEISISTAPPAPQLVTNSRKTTISFCLDRAEVHHRRRASTPKAEL